MRVITSLADLRPVLGSLRRIATQTDTDPTLGLVPTMGALHAGHLSLVAAARARCAVVVATIFVNPLQFAPTEDLARYPRTFDQDRALLQQAGVDMLFAPSPEEITPPTATTFVEVAGLSDRLDGASRPGHFRGVATIVAKLFHLTRPDLAFFGQKDAAQVAVLRALVRDLNLPIELVVCPTVREPDGLALSSRNRYLNPLERRQALILSHALHTAHDLHTTDAETLTDSLRATLATEPAFRLDYAAVVHPDTLLPLHSTQDGALLAVAGWVGTTRLIDNLLLPPQPNSVTESPALAGVAHA